MKKPLSRYVPVLAAFFALTALTLPSCKKESGSPHTSQASSVILRFHHVVDTLPLALDTLKYTSAAGDHFEITDLQYFISRVELHMLGGGIKEIASSGGIHYVDARIPESMQWYPSDEVPYGTYDYVSFIFGLDEGDNISNRFPDPPERDMFWPEILGGGYHYMKMNIKWQPSPSLELMPFNLHLGIGQTYSSAVPNTDSITGYVQNYFKVTLPASSFIAGNGAVVMDITMDLARWLNGPPNQVSLSELPTGIMQDEAAMHDFCLNGQDAFTVRIEK